MMEKSESLETKTATNESTNESTDTSTSKQNTTMFDIPALINTIIARKEATEIVVDIINIVIDILRKRGFELTSEETSEIQNIINIETKKTDKLYYELKETTLGATAKETELQESKSN